MRACSETQGRVGDVVGGNSEVSRARWARAVRRTLDTNMDIVLLRLCCLAGIFIRFRERVCASQVSKFRMRIRQTSGRPTEGLEVLDGHTTVGFARCRWGLLGYCACGGA
jgi:hypothetical protein